MAAETGLSAARVAQASRRRAVWEPRAGGSGVARVEPGDKGLSPAHQPLDNHLPSAVAMRLWPEPLDWTRMTDRDRDVYEIGFLTGFLMREDEVEQANADADRYYRAAFDRQQRRRY